MLLLPAAFQSTSLLITSPSFSKPTNPTPSSKENEFSCAGSTRTPTPGQPSARTLPRVTVYFLTAPSCGSVTMAASRSVPGSSTVYPKPSHPQPISVATPCEQEVPPPWLLLAYPATPSAPLADGPPPLGRSTFASIQHYSTPCYRCPQDPLTMHPHRADHQLLPPGCLCQRRFENCSLLSPIVRASPISLFFSYLVSYHLSNRAFSLGAAMGQIPGTRVPVPVVA